MLSIVGYEINKKLSSDDGTDVYHGKSSSDNCPVIIRHVKGFQSNNQFRHVQQLIHSANITSIENVLISFKQHNDLIIVSEDSESEPLAQQLIKNNFSLNEILDIISQLNSILGEVHAAGYVHKNINAKSVFIGPDNIITLGGLEYCAFSSGEKLVFSNTSQIEGIPAYISPEQTGRMNRQVDYRSDYYSLGMLMYEMLTGVLPCASVNVMTTIYCHLASEVEAPTQLNPRIPNMVSSIVLKLIEKNAQNRYQSTQGISGDLLNCINQVKRTGTITDFPLAEDDFLEQISFNGKMYDRDAELDFLLQEYACAAEGSKRVVFIGGDSGLGKTELTNELFRSIPADDFSFIKGKFDQQEKHQPYSAFIQAFEDFVRMLKDESVDEQDVWKQKIKIALQGTLNVLTELSSKLETFFGVQPQTELLGAVETKNRFKSVVSQFVACISTKKSPVVLVVDDMHWADNSSVELISDIIEDININYLLLIATHRNKELEANSFVQRLLARNYKNNIQPVKLNLKNFSLDEVELLLEDFLHQKSTEVSALAAQLFHETDGNPYFIKQLLSDLKNNHYFRFSKSKKAWIWGIIPELSDSKNVVELISARIKRLSGNELIALKYAAMLGNRFSDAELKSVSHIDSSAVDDLLVNLLNANFIHFYDNGYRFSHDRIQQSVISMLGPDEKVEIHYRIGMVFYEKMSLDQDETRIYEITSHLNCAIDKKRQDHDFVSTLRNLNFAAAKRAGSEAAYLIANMFSVYACSLLDENAWETEPEITFNIWFERAKNEYLTGDVEHSLKHVKYVCDNISSFEKQVKSFSLLKDIYTNQGLKYDELLNFSLEILRNAGEDVSFKPGLLKSLIENRQQWVDEYFAKYDVSSILSLPVASDKSSEVLVGFYMELWEAAYYIGRVDMMQFCILRMVTESLMFGNNPVSSFGYVLYASILSNIGRYDAAYALGSAALELNRSFSNKILIPKLNNLFCNYTCFHKKRFSQSVALYYESNQVAQQTGDYLFGVWATFFYVWSLFLTGENLSEILLKSDKHLLFVKQTNDEKMLQAYAMLQSFMKCYSNPISCDVNADKVILDNVEQWQKDGFIPGPVWYSILAMQRYYFEGEYEKALDVADKFATNLDEQIVMFPLSQFYFYRALCLIAKAKNSGESLLDIEKYQLAESQRIIEGWSFYCPENFTYQKALIQAEYASLINDVKVADFFSAAIAAADISDSNFVKALCFEKQAVYLQTAGLDADALSAYEKSAYFYQQWGAVEKARTLLASLLKENEGEINSLESQFSQNFELNSIIRASQAISSEINMDRLLLKMLSIALEDTYASYGLLFFVEDKEVYLAAENKDGLSSVFLNENILLNKVEDVAQSVVQRVVSGGRDIVIGDARQDTDFNTDPYVIRSRARSIMCSPISIHGHMIAVLYLENRLSANVFKTEPLPFFRTLLSQLAISLENARLYSGLKTEIVERKAVAEALRLSESRMKLSQKYAGVGAWEYDLKTRELFWSDAAKEIFGLSEDARIDSVDVFNDVVYPPDVEKISKAIDACYHEGGKYYVEHRVVLPNGDLKWVSESGDVSRNEHGEPIKLLGLVQDIDVRKAEELVRKELEQQLQQSQKMEAIGQLTGGIAHDFNNMLASIMGFAELAIENEVVISSDKVGEYLHEILAAGRRAKDLVSQMQAFSRNEDSVKEVVDIGLLVQGLLNMLKTMLTASIEINCRITSEALLADVNAVQIHQVIMNLCINARDAMSGLGVLLITVDSFSADSDICASCHENVIGDFVRVRVKDSGEGLLQEIADRIFQPFFTTKEVGKGTGMGLSMVHGIVHGSGGHILLDSAVGQGTTFTLLLPVATRRQFFVNDKDVEKSIFPATEPHQCNVLVVDDEISIGKFIVDSLASKNICAEVETDSLRTCERLTRAPDEFDLVIVDQTMPGMLGLELVEKLRKQNQHIQFILMTGFHEGIDAQLAIDAGCFGFLRKPFKISTLFSLLDDFKKI